MAKNTSEPSLFEEEGGIEENWREEWKGMPEFNNEDTAPFQSIIIHFKTEKDRNDFSALLGQKSTYKTKYMWFPKREELKPINFKYIGTNEP